MPMYRIYTLSTGERIHSAARVIEAGDDADALKTARQYLDGEALEVWDEKRLVGRLEPKRLSTLSKPTAR